MEGFAEVRPACASIKNLDEILTRVFLRLAPARYVPGSGPGISTPLRMSRLVIFTVFGMCVTVFIEFEFYICRSYEMGNTRLVSLFLQLVQIAQNPRSGLIGSQKYLLQPVPRTRDRAQYRLLWRIVRIPLLSSEINVDPVAPVEKRPTVRVAVRWTVRPSYGITPKRSRRLSFNSGLLECTPMPLTKLPNLVA